MAAPLPPFIPLVPEILRRGDAAKAFALVTKTRAAADDQILPEMMTLLATPGLSDTQRARMNAVLLSSHLAPAQAVMAGRLSADLGRLGFSFPQWRGLTQRFNGASVVEGASLVERYGMTRLFRANDVRDAALALSDPARDNFGPGFAIETDRHYIEYRRAYILCSHQDAANPAAILIRNNSYFFGRDRLAHPAYVSLRPLTIKDLQAVDARMNGFEDWRSFLKAPPPRSLQKIRDLITALDKHDLCLSRWLLADGFEDLRSFAAQPRPTPWHLAQLSATMPPWYPRVSQPLTPTLLHSLDRAALAHALRGHGEKLALLTGAQGDFPFKPQTY